MGDYAIMKYFTRQWIEESEAEQKSNNEEIGRILEEISALWSDSDSEEKLNQLRVRLKQLRLEQESSLGAMRQNAYLENYEKIESSLTEAIKSLTVTNDLHDCVIENTHFTGKDFCLKLYPSGIWHSRNTYSSVDYSSLKGESFFLSEVVFTNAKVLKNELTPDDICLLSEVNIHPEGYLFGILAMKPTNIHEDPQWAELTVVFDDIIIKVGG